MAHAAPNKAKCPVCGMLVPITCCGITAKRHGITYHMCSDACKTEFEKKCRGPKKGWWGRYLDRMDKSNRNSFGASGPKCH